MQTRKLHFLILISFSILCMASAKGQHGLSPELVMKEEMVRLVHRIHESSIDSNIVTKLSHYVERKSDSVYQKLMNDRSLSQLEKEKAVRSLVFFMEKLGENVNERSAEMYDIRGAFETYINVLRAIIGGQPVGRLVGPLSARRTQLLAAAFAQYDVHRVFEEAAAYKRMTAFPDYILRFLDSRPGFPYTDSLILVVAAARPMKVVNYLNGGGGVLRNRIRGISDKYVRQLVTMADDKRVRELLPFIIQVADNKLSTGEILEKRMEPSEYFKLMVNTLKEMSGDGESDRPFVNVLRAGIREKALAFYVNEINDLHSAPETKRFASVKNLRAEDLYYLITSCEEELYTSSFLGLFKRLMGHFRNSRADSLMQIVNYDNFRKFIRITANYNTLTVYLDQLSPESAGQQLKRFITGVETDVNTGLEKAMDIADCFTGLDSSTHIAGLIQEELEANYNRCMASEQYFGTRLYGILIQVLDLVREQNAFHKLWATLGNYEMLEREALMNSGGEINELVLFYGDEDGEASFRSFQKLFSDQSKWEFIKNENWATIRSRTDSPIVIYANLPLDSKEELDLQAQKALADYLSANSIEPTVLVHRGHSYHLRHTLEMLQPSVKLAILGSCGAYNNALSIASVNPDVQIIGSKKIGAKSINDPIIDKINSSLLDGENLLWSSVWADLAARFSKDPATLNLFYEYIPPGKNVSLFVLKLFNHYNRVL